MFSHLLALAAAGALCAGCSAPATQSTLSLDNPANPAAASVPFIRPVNVLAMGANPTTAVPSTAMHMSGGSMPGMQITGMTMSKAMPDMEHDTTPGMKVAQAQPSSGAADATGVVNAVDLTNRSVNVTHQPIEALGWPSMTMDFPVAPSVDLSRVKPGDKVAVTLGKPDAEGNRRIERITSPAAGSVQPGQAMPSMGHSAMPGMVMPGQSQ